MRRSIPKLTEFFALVRCHTSSLLGSNCASSTDLIDANASAARLKRGSPTKLSTTSRSDRYSPSWTLSFVLAEGFRRVVQVPSGGGGFRLEQRDTCYLGTQEPGLALQQDTFRTIAECKTSFDQFSSRISSTSSPVFLDREVPYLPVSENLTWQHREISLAYPFWPPTALRRHHVHGGARDLCPGVHEIQATCCILAMSLSTSQASQTR